MPVVSSRLGTSSVHSSTSTPHRRPVNPCGASWSTSDAAPSTGVLPGWLVERDPALAGNVRNLGDGEVETLVAAEHLRLPEWARHPGERRSDPLHPLQPGVRRERVVPAERRIVERVGEVVGVGGAEPRQGEEPCPEHRPQPTEQLGQRVALGRGLRQSPAHVVEHGPGLGALRAGLGCGHRPGDPEGGRRRAWPRADRRLSSAPRAARHAPWPVPSPRPRPDARTPPGPGRAPGRRGEAAGRHRRAVGLPRAAAGRGWRARPGHRAHPQRARGPRGR